MTGILKMIKGNLFIHPDDMYPDDPYIIHRDNQRFVFCKTESGEIQVFIDDDYNSLHRTKKGEAE